MEWNLIESADNYAGAIIQNINNINCVDGDNTPVLNNITIAMTDRYIVNKKVNNMLKSANQEECSTHLEYF